jgi:hypothetical protein
MGLSAKIKNWRRAALVNPKGFVESKIRIANLMGQEVNFKYKWGQQQFSDKKKELHATGKPVRLWVLKWRRAGITSCQSAESYAYVYGQDNARVGVIAHQEDRSKEILANYKAYNDSLIAWNPELELELSKDNIFGLKFARTKGQVLIATAENPIKIRGDGIHRMDGSEAAHWYEKFDNVMKEVCPVVPPMAGSEIILETTGSLRGSAPCDHYYEAKAGQNEFSALFLCWLDSPEEKIPFKSDKERDELMEKIHYMEPRLSEKNAFYKLTPEQIHMSWQMYFYQSKCDFDYFCREFPYTEDEAWSSGGSSYFGVYELGKARPEQPQYNFVFDESVLNHVFDDFGELRAVGSLDNYTTLPSLKVWALPQKGAKYVLGIDSASGEYGGDYTSGYLIDMHSREMMCAFHGQLRPDETGHIGVALCRMYNNAIAAPETNPAGGGAEVMNVMQRLGYHNFYDWRIRDSNKGLQRTNRLGWYTNSRSRPNMLNELRTIFLDVINGRIDDVGTFRDVALLDEMRTFGTDPRDGIPRANNNCHDDRVIAIAICNRVASDEVYCTSKDLIYAKHQLRKPGKVIDQSQLVRRPQDPNKVINQLMGKNSNFMRNKFEI